MGLETVRARACAAKVVSPATKKKEPKMQEAYVKLSFLIVLFFALNIQILMFSVRKCVQTIFKVEKLGPCFRMCLLSSGACSLVLTAAKNR